jgi:hypothetical protein
VPYPLKPEDFDWEQSRPHQPWWVGPVGPQSYTDPYWSWERQQIDWVELATADIENIFGASQSKAKRGPTDHDDESAATIVRDLLTKNEHLKRKDAFQSVLTKHPNITKRGFDHRIWPRGRDRESSTCCAAGTEAEIATLSAVNRFIGTSASFAFLNRRLKSLISKTHNRRT